MTRPELTPERWARVQDLLFDVLEQDATVRLDFLDRACKGDIGLADEVRTLLAACSTGDLLPHTLEARTPTEQLVLRWVGPYHLLHEIGRGGMGTVYLAERSGEGFTQRVALKLMRPDYADPRVIAALGAERRILARLEHPGIARFIDGGTTGSGQPFIAMEFVDGTPLMQYADAAALDVRARVALVADVCAAVQHAHRQLVVHRDLKPGNILVTGDGATKLLDFGIATVLDDSAREPSPESAHWLTPAYAAPEQLQRRQVTTLTDVYALGVVLYELLAGRSPYDFRDGSLASITSAICDVMPVPPSVMARRAGHADRARDIAGDLDQVVLRAIAKAPGERYGSVEQLSDDLRRWLEHRPVRAGPDSVGRRVRRFARRHRTLVVAGTVTVLALLVGLTATLWQARRAGAERDRAREALGRSEHVTGFLLGLFETADPRRVAGDTTIGRAILRLGLERVEQLDGQPIVQADVLDALGRVLGSLGQYERAVEVHIRALALRRSVLGMSDPATAPSLVGLGTALRLNARYVDAEARFREALALQQAAFGHDDPRVAATIMELAFLMPYLGREAEAEALHREARDIFARTVGPDDRRTLVARQRLIARVRIRDLAAAEADMRVLVADSRRVLGEDDPFSANLLFHLGDYVALSGRDPAEAERLYREGLMRVERRLGDRSLELVHGLHSLARLKGRQGDFATADSLARRALRINETLLGLDHEGTVGSLGFLAGLYERAGRLEDARRLRLDAIGRLERTLGPHHVTVAQFKSDLARLTLRMGDPARAETLWREAITDMRNAFGDEHHLVLRGRMQLAGILLTDGRTEEGTKLCTESVATLNRLYPPDHTIQREARAESPHCNWNGAGR